MKAAEKNPNVEKSMQRYQAAHYCAHSVNAPSLTCIFISSAEAAQKVRTLETASPREAVRRSSCVTVANI